MVATTGQAAADTYRTKADAFAHLASIEMDFRRGAWIDPRHGDLTVRALASQWLEANPAKRSSTLARDEAIVRLHVLPTLERRRIGDILTELAARHHLAVILVEHDLDFVREISSRVVVLHQGRIVLDGPVEEVVGSTLIRDIYAGSGHG